MSLLDQIFTINISSSSAAPSLPGFGTALLLSYHTHWTNRVRTYSGTAGMVADGFLVTDPAYKWASAYFAQNPSPQKLKIGRRATAPAQVNLITILASPPTGGTISFSLDGTVFTHTVASETAAQVATAIAAAVTAALPTNVSSATVSGGVIVFFTSVSGKLVNIINLSPQLATVRSDNAQGTNTTADVVACAAEDNDWYGLAIDCGSYDENAALAIYAEANKKLFVARSADSAVYDGTSTTDIGYVVKNLAYGRTLVLFNRAGGNLSYADAAMFGSRLPADPGSDTWAFKTLAGIPADTLTDSEITAMQAKRVTFYTSAATINFTDGGQVGGGEWADVVRGLDWVRAQLQIAQFSLALNRPKIPFTDTGIAMVKGVVLAVLKRAEKVGLFAENSTSVSAPAAADVSASDKAARNLPGVTWAATKSGAIHSTVVSGTVSV